MTSPIHIPVLLRESVEALKVRPGGRYIDCTVGTGGHALAIIERSLPGGQLLGIDADPEAIAVTRQRLAEFGEAVQLVNDNFANLESICTRYSFRPVDGILLDLGLSTLQLEGESRGFSFQREAPLDMRADPSQGLTAGEIVNSYPEAELARLLFEYGEERASRQISRHIVANRPINSTLHLVGVIEKSFKGKRGRIHPATRTFQALRIAVNNELENLQSALRQAVALLRPERRLVVISYHSLEDRIVKNFLRQEEKGCTCPPQLALCICGRQPTLKILTKRVVTPEAFERLTNPRSHSARMRVAERVCPGAGEGTPIADQGSAAKLTSGSIRRNENREIFVEPSPFGRFLEAALPLS
ncbi:MAG: rsmH [Dehalococcoidia bacterium]|nr:rsmH [Dehalococcoidia bacterium]